MLYGKDFISHVLKDVIRDLKMISQAGSIILRMPDGSLTLSSDVYAAVKSLDKRGYDSPKLRGALIDACKRSEFVSQGSTKYFVRTLAEFQRLLDANKDLVEIVTEFKQFRERLPNVIRPASMSSIKACLDSIAPDTSKIAMRAIELAGSECKIFIETSTTGDVVVERVDGNTFFMNVDPNYLKAGKITLQGAKVLIVDGLIESVSEIDSLLEACNKTKRSLIIIARGFSADVTSTLLVNYIRKTLNVIPATLEFDLETANVMNDIAVVLGTDVISSLKGELISTVKLDNLPIAKSVTCTGKSLTLMPDVSGDVKFHLNNLLEKRDAEQLPGIRSIIDKRIRSLSSSSVIIRMSDHGATGNKMMQDLDLCLKTVKNVLQYGVIMPEFIDDKCTCITLGNIVDAPCPTTTLSAGIKYATEFMESILRTGTLVSLYVS